MFLPVHDWQFIVLRRTYSVTTLDNVHHCCGILGARKESTGVHSSNDGIVPGSVLKVNTSAGFLREEGCHAVTTKDVPALRGEGMEIAEFVW
jgi:hypothetical protein